MDGWKTNSRFLLGQKANFQVRTVSFGEGTFKQRFEYLNNFPNILVCLLLWFHSWLFQAKSRSLGHFHRIASAIQSAPPPARRLALEPTLRIEHLKASWLSISLFQPLWQHLATIFGYSGVFATYFSPDS